jgi:hypothetical protein
MSGFSDFQAFECVVQYCPLYNADLPFAYLTIVFDFYPVFLTFGIFLLSLNSNELYYTLVSYTLTLGTLLSMMLQTLIGVPSQFPGKIITYIYTHARAHTHTKKRIDLFILMIPKAKVVDTKMRCQHSLPNT